MIEIELFLKYANVSTAATLRLDSTIIVTVVTIAFQLFLKR